MVYTHKPFDVVFSKRLLFGVEVAKSLKNVIALNVLRNYKSGARFVLCACAVGSLFFKVNSDKVGWLRRKVSLVRFHSKSLSR